MPCGWIYGGVVQKNVKHLHHIFFNMRLLGKFRCPKIHPTKSPQHIWHLRLRHRLQGWQVTSLGCGYLWVANNLWVSSGCHEDLLCRANRWKLDHSRTWSDGKALGWKKLGLMGFFVGGKWWLKLGLNHLVGKKPVGSCLFQHVSYFFCIFFLLGHRHFKYG